MKHQIKQIRAIQVQLDKDCPTNGDGYWSLKFIEECLNGQHQTEPNRAEVIKAAEKVGMTATQTYATTKRINATSLNNAKQQWHASRNEFGDFTSEENKMAEAIKNFDREELREIAADYMDSEMWEVLEMFRRGFGAQGGSNNDKLKMVSYWCDLIWDEVESRVFSRLVESGEITL